MFPIGFLAVRCGSFSGKYSNVIILQSKLFFHQIAFCRKALRHEIFPRCSWYAQNSAISLLPSVVFRSYSTRRSLKSEENSKITELFPQPLTTLHNLKIHHKNKLGGQPLFSVRFKRVSDSHICELELNWPEIQLFSGVGRRKTTAQKHAAIIALDWLYSNKLITRESKLVLKDVANRKNNLLINFDDDILAKMDDVLKLHSERVIPALSASKREDSTSDDLLVQDNLHPTLGIPFPCSEDMEKLNEALKQHKSVTLPRLALPIDNYRQKILETVKTNRVTIIKGETGCGKTTRVPQFILDEAIAEGLGAHCNVAVVQPRRLTTIQTAKFVAYERGEQVGGSVGYNVKMATVLPCVIGGSITFLTGMKLAQKFTNDPSLQGVSHVVLDEVHMRDIGTDLVMTLLKQAMKVNANIKVIIMSATVNTSIFQSYYNCFGNVPVVEVPGRTFPVEMHFLDDLPSHLVPQNTQEEEELGVDFHLVHRVVSWINKTKPEGGILIFVSGWNDMSQLQKYLCQERNLLIIPVHSMFRDCSAAFESAKGGKRKVILATNIAETSLTFPDIVYVLDCGIHKKPQRNLLSPGGWSSSKMSTQLITKANVFQRRGRAGRVQPGESYHLYTKETFENMENYEMPSIMCESLEYLVLSVKMVNPGIKASHLLKEFPTPPSDEDVRDVVYTLQKASLLSRDDEKPTPLATAVMGMSSSLPSALALVSGAIFRCLDLTLSVVACEETPLVLRSRDENSSTSERSLKMLHHNSSDHIAKGLAITEKSQPSNQHPSFRHSKALKKFLRKQVMQGKGFFSIDLNEHNSQQLVLSILLNSFGSLLIRSHGPSLNVYLCDKSGFPASIRSRSVNHKFENTASPFFMYLSGHTSRTNHLAISDTSVVSPLTVLLFLPSAFKAVEDSESAMTTVKAWRRSDVSFIVSSRHFSRIKGLRRALKDVQDYFVRAEILNQPDDNFDLLSQFRKQLIECIKDILTLKES